MKPKPKKQKAKPVYGWVVKNIKNNIYWLETLAHTKQGCLRNFKDIFRYFFITPLNDYRSIKVKIEEV